MTQVSLTNAELAILSLVAERPCHGYQVEQLIEQRGMRSWTEVGFSSIYFLLNKLERRGLVQAHLEPAAGRGPARKVYQATPDGQRALAEGVRRALSIPQRGSLGLQLGLANLPVLPPAEARLALEAYRRELQGQFQALERRWQAQAAGGLNHRLPFFVDAMFEHSLALIQAELGWLEGFLERLSQVSQGPGGPIERLQGDET